MNRIIKAVLLCSIYFTSCKTVKPLNDCKGTAKPDCMCTMDYKPVCGCNGKTYSNPCMAGCAGIKTWTEGECKN